LRIFQDSKSSIGHHDFFFFRISDFQIISLIISARIFNLTLLAMIAFAGNSLLCRVALKQTSIDAATFTLVRIVSGAIALGLIVFARKSRAQLAGNWPSAVALFVYAAAFSFAYVDLAAGTGALLLFGAVQVTMILRGLFKGERLRAIQLVGFVVALIGLIALLLPGLSAPPLAGALLMLGAGVAWGIYSLRGKGVVDATSETAGNFVRAVPLSVAISLILIARSHVDLTGIVYAIVSGAITSGMGYVIWYSALPGLKSASAATVQLSVPVLAATGGILLLHEPITLRYVVASTAVLGGIALVILERRSVANSKLDVRA
jgi:drug/metabolite transporter (DMT)-like permease